MDPGTFEEYIKTLPEHIQCLLHTFKFEPGGKQVLHEYLQNNRLIKVGMDGYLNKGKETTSFGWILIGMKQKLVAGAGPVDGVPDFLSSTHLELFGITAPNKFLHHFMMFHRINSTSKVIKCVNNRAAITQINKTQ
jgi:hypothetical protein